MKFSIMITTRNRRDDLQLTLTRLQSLRPYPAEVMVCADGCTDDTVAMVTEQHPSITLIRNEQGQGSVASRDRMLRQLQGDWVLSIDDDSYPLDDDFFARAESLIQAHPEVAVFTFPEQRDGEVYTSAQKSPTAPSHYAAAYPNCAALMDRSFYLQQPGFPPSFFHMYEETDYSLQCYAAGRGVWFESSLIFRHHLSAAQRQPVRRHHQNARNELWSVWRRCPWPWLPAVAAFRVWRQFRYACTEGLGWAVREPIWWWAALRGAPDCWQRRQPVSWSRYLAWMKLARQPMSQLGEFQNAFAAP